MAKSNLRLVAPDSELRTVTLRRRSNSEMGRDREHLTEREVECLIRAAKGNRHGHRDATMILIGFRHGLRVSELCSLQWSSIEFETGTVYVKFPRGGEAGWNWHPPLAPQLPMPIGSLAVTQSERGATNSSRNGKSGIVPPLALGTGARA